MYLWKSQDIAITKQFLTLPGGLMVLSWHMTTNLSVPDNSSCWHQCSWPDPSPPNSPLLSKCPWQEHSQTPFSCQHCLDHGATLEDIWCQRGHIWDWWESGWGRGQDTPVPCLSNFFCRQPQHDQDDEMCSTTWRSQTILLSWFYQQRWHFWCQDQPGNIIPR